MPADVPDFSTAVTQPAVHQATLNVPADGLPHQFDVSPPSGTHALGFVCTDNQGGVKLQQVLGLNSQNYFLSDLAGGPLDFFGQAVLVPVFLDTGYETEFQVQLVNNGGGPFDVDVFAILDAEAVAAWVGFPGQLQKSRSLSVVLASDQGALTVAPAAPKAWDQVATMETAAGSAPSITIPAPGVGLHNQLDHLSLTLGMIAPGAAFNGSLKVRDASSSGTILWQEAIAMDATAGGLLNIERADMRLRQPNANTALWIGVDTVSADAGGGLNAGCYSVS